jgi:peptidoglycan hydrolase-like protein with peptidoglycan-binding domain
MYRIDPEALPHRLDQVPDPTDEPPAEDTTCRRTRRIIGSQSDEEEIAALLRLHGWGTALDGVVGFWTKRALIEFQHANGLDTTGEPDEVTRILLECADAAGHTAYLDNPLPPLAGGAPAVLGVQQSLARLGWSLALDGLSGPATRRAIREFQHANGLPVTGAVDDAIAALATMPSARGYREYLSDPLPAAPSRPLSTEDMLAKVEQIVDSVGFDWRQHGVTLAIGCATTCGGGQYDPRTSTI